MRPHRTLGNSLGLGAVVLMLGLLGAELAELAHWAACWPVSPAGRWSKRAVPPRRHSHD